MLDEGDKAICAEVAGEVCEKIILGHIKSCPHGIKMGKFCWMLIGAGGFGGFGLSEIIRHFL